MTCSWPRGLPCLEGEWRVDSHCSEQWGQPGHCRRVRSTVAAELRGGSESASKGLGRSRQRQKGIPGRRCVLSTGLEVYKSLRTQLLTHAHMHTLTPQTGVTEIYPGQESPWLLRGEHL